MNTDYFDEMFKLLELIFYDSYFYLDSVDQHRLRKYIPEKFIRMRTDDIAFLTKSHKFSPRIGDTVRTMVDKVPPINYFDPKNSKATNYWFNYEVIEIDGDNCKLIYRGLGKC